MRHFAFLIFPVFLLISGCDKALTGNAVDVQNPYESNINAQVYFCPQDNCESVLEAYVDYAKSSVHCAFFELNLKDLITMIAKKSYDADVKVVIDEGNYDGQIKGGGVKTAKSKQYMHNKFCIIDKYITLTGSTNPTNNGANLNNNNIIILNSKYIAENTFRETIKDRVLYNILFTIIKLRDNVKELFWIIYNNFYILHFIWN